MQSSSLLFLLSALTALAHGKTIDIAVGQDGLVFSPESPTAAKGDILSFHFYSTIGPHSVVSSTFEKPCVPDEGAFFSGLLEGTESGSQTFEVEVKDTDPIWFYCSSGHHCQAGMVGVVNPPSDKTSSQYAAAAANVAAASAPSAPTGGYNPSSTGSSPSSTSASAAHSSTASGAATSSAASVTSSVASSVSSVASSASSAASSASSVASSQTSSAAAATSSQPGVAGHNDAKAAGALAVLAGGLVALLA